MKSSKSMMNAVTRPTMIPKFIPSTTEGVNNRTAPDYFMIGNAAPGNQQKIALTNLSK
jgi:hypothetical protein